MHQNAPPIVVIGAGVGGLSAAIHLAAAGRRVVVLEQSGQVGGKMGEFRHAGFRWDTGPSLITMRPAFEGLFAAAGRRLEEALADVELREGAERGLPRPVELVENDVSDVHVCPLERAGAVPASS